MRRIQQDSQRYPYGNLKLKSVPSILISLILRLLLCRPRPGLLPTSTSEGANRCSGVGLPGAEPYPREDISRDDSNGVSGIVSTTIDGISVIWFSFMQCESVHTAYLSSQTLIDVFVPCVPRSDVGAKWSSAENGHDLDWPSLLQVYWYASE